MKIIELPPYYMPERISSSHLTDDLEWGFIDAGFDFVVYAPIPTRGITDDVYKENKKIKKCTLKNGHISVNRFWMFREGKNPLVRALRYIFTNLIQYHKGIREQEVDVILGGSTPPTQALLCSLVKRKLSKKGKRVPFVYLLQDIFPDSLVSVGMTQEGSFLWKIGRKIENYSYNNADAIIVISDDMKTNILAKGVPIEKVTVIPNWIDIHEVKPITINQNSLVGDLGINSSSFKVVYAGNLGKAQGVQTIIEAAGRLQGEKNIEFVIFGNGVEEESIRELINDKELSNVKLYPLQPNEKISEVYSLGDVCLVTCKRGTGLGAFPSKTVSIMATGTPIIAAFDVKSELCRVIRENDCGICVEPENPSELAKVILDYYHNQDELLNKGKNARNLVEREYSREKCVSLYTKLLLDIVKNGTY